MLQEFEKIHPFDLEKYLWQTRKEIGRSQYGITYKVQIRKKNNWYMNQQKDKFVAIRKFIFPKIIKVSQVFKNELNKINGINSLHIVKYFQNRIYDQGGYIVMQLCQTDLQEYLDCYERRIPDSVAKVMIKSMTNAIGLLRSKGYNCVYINPKNFLIKDRYVKFNPISSRKYEYINMEDLSISSAPLYMAPQILLMGDLNKEETDSRADVWSMGVIAYQLAVGILPFSYRSWRVHKDKMISESVTLSQKFKMPQLLHDFIAKCLCKDKKFRMPWQNLQKHPYILNCQQRQISQYETPEAANFWSKIKAQKQDTTNIPQFYNHIQGKTYCDLSQFLKQIDQKQLQYSLKPEMKENIQKIEKKQLLEKFSEFKLDQDNEYAFLWRLSKTIQKKKIDIYKISDKFDFNRNKYIEYSEMKGLINSILPKTNQATINNVWSTLKQMHNGNITTENMLKQLLGRLPSEQEQIKKRAVQGVAKLKSALRTNKEQRKKIFQYFDLNKDNQLSLKEFERLYNTFVGFQRQEEIRIMFNLLDRDSNGIINQKELAELWKGV